MELTPGASLGPYKILEEIGSGHMGKVYLAHDERLDRRVALKTLTGSTGSEAERRLKKEARAIARLNNPNIAALYDLAEYDGISLLVMEYADGESLSDLVVADIGVDRTIDIGLQLTNALAYAHREGIIHRDVKPANVKLTRGGMVKLLDLGIARVSASDPGATTRDLADTAVAAGTPAYMAPERLRGHPADVRTDVYSVGVLLFELLTGGRPYPQRDMFSLHAAMGRSQAPRARAINPKVPRTLDDVVAKAMAHDPRLRYSSAVELHDDLLRARDSSSRRVVPIVTPRSGFGWTVLAGVAVIAAAIIWAVTRPSLPPAPPTFAVALPVNDSPYQLELDELGSLMQSVIARNFADAPGITIVPVSPAKPSDAPPGYSAAVTLRHATAGVAGDVALSRLGKVGPRIPIDGDELKVLRSTLDDLAEAFERAYSTDKAFTDEGRTNLRRVPTENVAALNSYLLGRSLLNTSDDAATDDQAIAAFQDAISRDRNFAFAHAGLSQAYASYNKHADHKVSDRAKVTAGAALALDSRSDQAHIAMALAHYGDRDYNHAIDEARKAIVLTPDSADGHRVLGTALIASREYAAGLSELRTAVSLDGKNLMNLYALGRGLLVANKPDEAAPLLRKVTEGLPKFESAFANLSNAELSQGQWDFAIGDGTTAVQLNGRDAAAANNLGTAYFWRAAPDGDPNGFQNALKAYQRAAQFDPNNAKVRMNLGDAYEAVQKKNDAWREYRKAVELVDARPKTDYSDDLEAIAAKCQAKLGDFADAEPRALQAVSASHGTNANTLYKLAVVYALWNKQDAAVDALEKAVGLGYPLVLFRHDPDLKSLRADVRFKKLISPPGG
jgi:serine/threonine protein kinase/tetratricopeptide (TPR) repeat protein